MKPRDYHERTSYTRGRLGGGWREKGDVPSLFKLYHGVPYVTLARDFSLPPVTLEDLLCLKPKTTYTGFPFNFTILSVFLFLSYGITAILRDERFSFRTVPSAGALYPSELYIAVSGIPDLRPGIYHYNPAQHSLAEIATFEDNLSYAPFVQAFISGIFYRSSFKYRERAFRYVLLDGGHLLEQVFLAGRAVGFRPAVTAAGSALPPGTNSWEDFIGLDCRHEIVLGTVIFEANPAYGKINYSLDLETLRSYSKVARNSPVPPSIADVSKTTSGDIFVAKEHNLESEDAPPYSCEPLNVPFARITLSRRSRRDFLIHPVHSRAILSFLKVLKGLYTENIRIFFVVERCGDTFRDGIYELKCENKKTILKALKYGSFLSSCARASLDQMWLSDAVLHVVMATSVEMLEKKPSLYRDILIQAGRVGQRVYLTAEALGLGCCGIGAFYDDELRRVFDLSPGWEVLYLLGVGVIS